MEQQHRNPTWENDQNSQIPQNSSLPESRTTSINEVPPQNQIDQNQPDTSNQPLSIPASNTNLPFQAPNLLSSTESFLKTLNNFEPI